MMSAAEPAPTRRDEVAPWQPAPLSLVPTRRDQPSSASWSDIPSSSIDSSNILSSHAVATRRDGAGPGAPRVEPHLPAELAARFQFVATLPQHGSEADVVRVRDTTGQDLILKLYRPEISPDPDVWRALPRLHDPHLVRVHETGQAGGRSYELMEYLPGGNLRALTGYRFDTATITEVVRQLSAGLAALHSANITHRDIKPENVLLRSDDPMEFVLTDFGLSRHLDQSMIFSTAARTLIYTAPETFYDHVSFARDWWSLGVVVHELATGKRPFEGLSEHPIMMQLSRHAFPVDDVVDPRLRLLCRGLLVHDFESRWGLAQVRQWLAGESPAVPTHRGPVDQPTSSVRPFLFMSEHYTEPRLLGLAMAHNWDTATRLHFARLGEHWNDLRAWLAQFDDPDRFDVAGRREMVDELSEPGAANPKLLRLLAWLDPTLPPNYRGLSLAPRHVLAVALAAANGDPRSAAVVEDLWEHRLLPVLARFAGAAQLAGLDSRWRALLAEFDRIAGELATHTPQVAARLSDPEALAWARAVLLAQAASSSSVTTAVRDQVRQVRRGLPAPVPWFAKFFRDMGHVPQRVVIAQLVSSLAVAEAEALIREREINARQPLARRTLWQQQERHRLAGRGAALGWALAGVGTLLPPWLCYLWLLASGLVARGPVAGDTVTGGTVGVLGVLTMLVVAGAEVFLAWRLGRSYSPEYALFWSLRRTLQQVGAVMELRVSGRTLWFAGAGGVVLVILTMTMPIVVPIVVMAAHLWWVQRRERSWAQAHSREKREALGMR